MVTKPVTEYEKELLLYASSKANKYGVVKFQNSDHDYIIVLETKQIKDYTVELVDVHGYLVPVVAFESGKYNSFENIGLFESNEAEPQLQSLAAVVDMHLGTRHYF